MKIKMIKRSQQDGITHYIIARYIPCNLGSISAASSISWLNRTVAPKSICPGRSHSDDLWPRSLCKIDSTVDHWFRWEPKMSTIAHRMPALWAVVRAVRTNYLAQHPRSLRCFHRVSIPSTVDRFLVGSHKLARMAHDE